MLTLAQLGEFVAQHHTHDLFRLETLPRYSTVSDSDDFRRYLRGEPAPTAEAKQPWLDRLRADADAGRNWRKVHVVRGAISDYERYEFEWGFAYNVTAGEDIRILDASETSPSDGVGQLGDFFVLDHTYVVRSHYDDHYRFTHAQVLNDPQPYLAVADFVWAAAEPFPTWWATHTEYHRDATKAA